MQTAESNCLAKDFGVNSVQPQLAPPLPKNKKKNKKERKNKKKKQKEDNNSKKKPKEKCPNPNDFTVNLLKLLTWNSSDIPEDNNNPTGIFGVPFNEWKKLHLRTMATVLKVLGAQSRRKNNIIELITIVHKNKKRFATSFRRTMN